MIPRRRGEPPRDLSKPLEAITVEIDATLDGARLDVALTRFLTWRSRTSILSLIRDGHVTLVGRQARKSSRVRKGEAIVIEIPGRPAPDATIAPADDVIPVLYQDDGLIAVDKPAGLAVHPAGRRVYGTLIHWLHTRYRRPDDPAHDVVPRLLHRIDRETSGLLMASLDPDLHARVAIQFEERTVRKVYQAVVHGCPPDEDGMIDLGIGPDRRSAVKLKLRATTDGSGLHALTHYRVLRRTARFSLVELRPRTGRTHQLRVHMAAIGCPLVGDKIYGVEDAVFLEYLAGELSPATREQLILGRHALHSASVEFFHPWQQRSMVLSAPLPVDLAGLVGADPV
jgi:23S rRNA pseudouridine1911/1915/1917 synthase